MTSSPTRAGAAVLAEPIDLFGEHLSLIHGWAPVTAQAFAVVTMVLAIGWRNRRWRVVAVPAAAHTGVMLAVLARWSLSVSVLAVPTAGLSAALMLNT